VTFADHPELSIAIPQIWDAIEDRTRALIDEKFAAIFGPYLRAQRIDNTMIVGEKHPPMLIFGDGSNVPSTGVKAWWPFDYPYQIQQWTIIADAIGSLAITLSQSTYATYPTFTPLSGTGAISLVTQRANRSTTLTLWTTTQLAADTIVQVNLDSVSTIHRAMLWLSGARL
jgi:hypothetical protein